MQYDEIMEDLLVREETPTPDTFGGIEQLLRDGRVIGKSLFSDVFVDLVLPFRTSRGAEVDGFLVNVLDVIERGPELNTIAERLLAIHFEEPAAEVKVFRRFLAVAMERGRPVPFRNAALKGALAFARDDVIRISRLVADIAETSADDNPEFISHAARIAGVLSGRDRSPALPAFLRLVRDVDGSADQVHFELGLISLQRAIEADETTTVVEHLKAARDALDRASALRESRHDARLYSGAINVLLGFHQRRTPPDLAASLRSMREDAFAYSEYSLGGKSDPILGSIATQVAALTSLVASLHELVAKVAEDIWLDAIQIIETHLLFAYQANRSVFAGQPGHGIDCVIRPSLEPQLFGNRSHLDHLSAWMKRHSSKFDAGLTSDLKDAIHRAFEDGVGFPQGAGSSGPLDPALQERVRFTDQEAFQELVEMALRNLQAQQIANSSPAVGRLLETIDNAFAVLEDYRVPSIRMEFITLAFGIATFLARKLDSSVEQDAFSRYLFQHGKSLPLEKELQQDFLRHGHSAGLPVDDEVKGVAGGRADVRYRSKGITMIIEVKRELVDGSFDNLIASYADQTVIYQTTNVKLGVMMVLDLSKDHCRLGHMDTWYETRTGDFLGDRTERGVLIVKIPGRRGTPSAATVAAKRRNVKGKPPAAPSGGA